MHHRYQWNDSEGEMNAMITAETWIRGSAEAASIIGMNAKSGKMLPDPPQ